MSPSILKRWPWATRFAADDHALPLAFERLEQRTCLSTPDGPEFLINTTTAGVQSASGVVSVASDPAGGSTVVWESFNQDALLTWGIFGRNTSANGTPNGPEFSANPGTLLNDQRRPTVARTPGGGFVVAWDGAGLLGLFPSIYVQRFDASGAALGGVIGVATGTAITAKSGASVSVAPDGSFVVAWESSNQDALLTTGVYARMYNADGSAVGTEFRVNETIAGNQGAPVVGRDLNGNAIVAWSGQGSGDNAGVFWRAFNDNGAAITGEQLVNSTVAGVQQSPALAIAADGSFIIAWDGATIGDSGGIAMQRFGSNLLGIGGELRINEVTSGIQADAAIAIDADGDFLVAWAGEGTGDVNGIFAREYAQNGTPRGGTVLVNTTVVGLQELPAIASTGDNGYIAVWSGQGIGDADGVFARSFVNDAPVLSAGPGSAVFIENGPEVPVDPSLSISDPDHESITGATVSIANGYSTGEDTLTFALQAGIVASWDPLAGVLSLTGTASIAAYQAALRTVGYVNGSENPSAAARTVQFRVNDGVSLSGPAQRVVTVTPVNDAPVLTIGSGPAQFTENGPQIALDALLTTSDVDSLTLTGAAVALTANYAAGQDSLQFVAVSGISGVWDSSTGVLTLSGVASMAAYQLALRSVTYSNSSENPSVAARTVQLTISDGQATSTPVSVQVIVTAVNDAPTVSTTPVPLVYPENAGVVTVDPSVGIFDVDSPVLTGASVRLSANWSPAQDVLWFADQLGITGLWDGSFGILTLTGTASVAAYQTALRSIGYSNLSEDPDSAARSIEFTVNDGALWAIAAVRSITVLPINDRPVVLTSGGAATFTENGPAIAVDAAVLVADVDSAVIVGATVAIASNYVAGEDVLEFSDQLGITGSWNALTGVLTLTGPAPVAAYQEALRRVRYRNTSEDPASVIRSLAFTVTDGSDPSLVASRAVSVIAMNDAPSLSGSPGTVIYVENASPTQVDPLLIALDVDSTHLTEARVALLNWSAEDLLQLIPWPGITGTWDPATGVLTLAGLASVAEYQGALRSITYWNDSDNPAAGTRTVSFTLFDGIDLSAAFERMLSVVPVNDAPALVGATGLVGYVENSSPIGLNALIGVSDPDSPLLIGATVRIALGFVPDEDTLFSPGSGSIAVQWNSLLGVLTLSGAATLAEYEAVLRGVAYSNRSENPSSAARVLLVEVDDGSAGASAAFAVISVIPVNDAPLVETGGSTPMFIENGPAVFLDTGIALSDPDSTMLGGATIAFVGGYSPGFDHLDFINQAGITGSWDGSAGILHLSGTATVEDYQAAVRSVTFANASERPSTSPRTISITVSDAADNSVHRVWALSLTEVADAPVVTTTGATLAYAGTHSAPVDPLLLLDDPDSDLLVGATVRIGAGYVPGTDALVFQDLPGIRGRWDAQTGLLHLEGVATLAEYQAALRTVEYRSLAVRANSEGRVVTFSVDDGSMIGFGIRAMALIPNLPPVEPPVGPPPPPVSPPPAPPVVPPAPPSQPPAVPPAQPPAVPPTQPPSSPPLPEPPIQVPPPSGPPAPPAPGPPTQVPPLPPVTPSPVAPDPAPAQPEAAPAPAITSRPPATPPAPEEVEPRSLAPGIQVVDVTPLPQGALDALSAVGLQSWLIIAIAETGGLVTAGCGLWLIANYSVARHTLLTLSKFNLVDLRCLLIMARSTHATGGAA